MVPYWTISIAAVASKTQRARSRATAGSASVGRAMYRRMPK